MAVPSEMQSKGGARLPHALRNADCRGMDPDREPTDVMPKNLVDLSNEDSLEFRALWKMVSCAEALTPQQISTLLGDVGVAEVKAAIRSLCDERLVYRQIEGKSLYLVDPLAVFLQIERQDEEFESQFEERKRQLKLLRKHTRLLAVADQHVPFPEESIRLPPGLAKSYTRHAISNAVSEVAISSYRFNWFYAVEDILRTKAKEGVSFTVVITDPGKAEFFRREHKQVLQRTNEQLRAMGVKIHLLTEKPVFRGTLIDNEICLVTMYDPRSETADDCLIGLLLLKEPTLLSLVRRYFRTVGHTPEKSDFRMDRHDGE